MSRPGCQLLSTSVVVGPEHHGVVRHAIAVARLTGSPVLRLPDPRERPATPTTPIAHLHYTDRLFGSTSDRAAGACLELIRRLACPAVVTLHDVPNGNCTEHDRRRAAAYRHLATSVDAVVVSSGHERERLRACGVSAEPTVIPLPIEPIAPVAATETFDVAGPMVAVLGHIYPGKGHRAVLEALSTRRDDLALWAVGAVSPGHDDLLGELERFAVRARRRIVVTGHLDDAALAAAVRRTDVPVVPAAAPSASASLATWIAHGRRPLTADSAYAGELVAEAPELVMRYRPNDVRELAAAISRALDEPASTVQSAPIPERFRGRAVAAQHRAVYRGVADRRG